MNRREVDRRKYLVVFRVGKVNEVVKVRGLSLAKAMSREFSGRIEPAKVVRDE